MSQKFTKANGGFCYSPSMENVNLACVSLLGFLIIWSLVYWIVPLVVIRLREQRKQDEPHHSSFLSETGTIHRLGRDSGSDSR